MREIRNAEFYSDLAGGIFKLLLQWAIGSVGFAVILKILSFFASFLLMVVDVLGESHFVDRILGMTWGQLYVAALGLSFCFLPWLMLTPEEFKFEYSLTDKMQTALQNTRIVLAVIGVIIVLFTPIAILAFFVGIIAVMLGLAARH